MEHDAEPAKDDAGQRKENGRIDWVAALQSPSVAKELADDIVAVLRDDEWRRAGPALAFLEDLAHALKLESLSFLLDCFAKANYSFDGDFHLDLSVHIEILNETNVSSASDELVAQVAQLLVNRVSAGPYLFVGMMELNSPMAWRYRLLSPVLEQVYGSERATLQYRAVASPEPHLFRMLKSAGLWHRGLSEDWWLQHCGNVDALSMLLDQYDVDSCEYGHRTALFGKHRNIHNLEAFNQVTRALLDAGADPHLLVSSELPALAVLEVVFERMAPQTLFPTAADLLCPWARDYEGPAVVSLLLKHGYTVDEGCLRNLEDTDSFLATHEWDLKWPRRCVWYALLFHRLIDAIPPGIRADVRLFLRRCMSDWDPLLCRVAWLPHTHHVFPDPFKSRVMMFLLCIKRMCPLMPRDIRQIIIARLARAEMRSRVVQYSVE